MEVQTQGDGDKPNEVAANDTDNAGARVCPTGLAPAGRISPDEAARLFGVSVGTWYGWESAGKVPPATWVALPRGGRAKFYSADAVERMRQASVAADAFPPPGMVDRPGAGAMFGVSRRTWSTGEKEGRIADVGQMVSVLGKPGKSKVHPIAELEPIKQQMVRLQRREPYEDPDRPGVWRVPIVSNKHAGLEALIDAIDLPVAQGRRWNWTGGRADGSGASVLTPGGGALARLIMGVADDPEQLICHVNNDRLDCRRENLIVRSRSEVRRAAKRPKKWEGLEPYPDPDRPGVMRVPILTEKHKGMEALIDAADFPLIQGKRWNWSPGRPDPSKDGSVILAMTGTPKPTLTRIILGIEDPEQLVCHVNGDRLDCRRENLAVRTRAQVRIASRKMLSKGGKACTSRFKGVTRTESGRKWAATIHVGGEYRSLGRFRSEIDAALAYDAALRELMGEGVAGLNLPDQAEAERLRTLEPIEEDGPFPPPGMVDRHGACAMFGVSLTTWMVWERKGRIACGEFHPLPNDKPGRCKLYPKAELERLRVEIEQLGKPYPDPDRLGVWRVPLKGYLTYREALIDQADLPIVDGKNWNWSGRSDEGKSDGNVILATTGRTVHLHRLIAAVTDPRMHVGSANGDPLDCRRENLVVRTLAETNQTNRKMGTVSGRKYSSGFKGVSHDGERNKWVVQIRKGGVGLSLGRFESELEAAMAYDAAARVLFGEHCYLNLPDQPSSEQAMSDARRALDSTANRLHVERRRQRDLERELRRAAADSTHHRGRPSDNDGAMITEETARLLFDVTSTVWKRWHRFAWLPTESIVDEQLMYPLAEIEPLLRRCGLNALPYPDPQRLGVFRVPLAGETAQGREALIDADAVPLVQTRRWRFAATEMGRGGEVQTMNPAENIRLHYVVMGIASEKEQHIGHRNDDPLDCRRANLVVRTLTDTAANKRKQATFGGRPCTSRFKGVCRPQRSKRWVASIKKDRVKRSLGTFHDEIAAAQAYDEAARELFGEHARLNFPDGVDTRLERESQQREAA